MNEREVAISVDHLLRHNSGQMVAVLTRIFGFRHIDSIEDAIQEALLKALKTWPYGGVPDNPTAWLIQVAKNRLFDQLRREGRSVSYADEFKETERVANLAQDKVFFGKEIAEDQLRMIFACCHPSIPKDSQVALTLKTVGGFNNREIASAFLARRPAIDKMLVRAKSRLKRHRKGFGIPDPEALGKRLDAVLKVIYLMFNEGYMASEGEQLIREDLCYEAIRLVKILASHELTSTPKANALAALLHFQASRLPARSGPDGFPALLADQDRSSWDRSLIGVGIQFLRASASGDELSEYHLEAEVASHHVLADSYDSTNWEGILDCYERILEFRHSPIAALNRAYALGKVRGPSEALEILNQKEFEQLHDYYPFHVTKAQFLGELGLIEEAIASYRLALDLTSNNSVRGHVEGKIKAFELAAA